MACLDPCEKNSVIGLVHLTICGRCDSHQPWDLVQHGRDDDVSGSGSGN